MDDVLTYKRKRLSSYFPSENEKSSVAPHSSNSSVPHNNTTFRGMSEYQSIRDAIESNDIKKVKRFFQIYPEVDVNKVYDDCGLTLLHFAVGVSENKPEIVEFLLKKGGKPNNTNVEDNLTPLHLSALYDFDKVMHVLINAGGNLEVRSTDGYNCYEIVKQNIENELYENCFKYLFLRNRNFRKSMGPRLSSAQSSMTVMRKSNATSISDGSVNSDVSDCCESLLDNAAKQPKGSRKSNIHSAAQRLFPDQYEYLMSEDGMSKNVTQPKKTKQQFSRVNEDSGVTLNSYSSKSYFGHSASSVTRQPTLKSSQCATNLPSNQPTIDDLEKLRETFNQLKVNTSAAPSSCTSGLFSQFSGSVFSLHSSMALQYSPELQDGMKDLNLIREWGNLKVELVQNSNHENRIKSYKNYLLLNTKILKHVNYSANHLKTSVIDSPEKFQKFLESIFHIGHVKGNQPLEPLVIAKEHFYSRRKSNKPKNNTISNILDIWKSGLGIRVVEVFPHSSESEVYVNQAAMIDALGSELEHLKTGNLDGTEVSHWTQKMKNQFGSFLLHNCYRTFLVKNDKDKKGIFHTDEL